MLAFCEICNDYVDLRTHLKKHKISSKDYYDKYLKKPNEGICKHCSKPTKFLGIYKGYRSFCSNLCHQLDPESTEQRVTHYKETGSGSEKRKKTWKKKPIEEKQLMVDRRQETMRQKYGVDSFSQTREWKEMVPKKISETNKVLFNTEEMKQFQRENTMRLFGTDNVFKLPEVKAKIRNTLNVKYKGIGFQSKDIKDKANTTHIENTGYDIWHDPEIVKDRQSKYTYNGQNFDSSWELAFYN